MSCVKGVTFLTIPLYDFVALALASLSISTTILRGVLALDWQAKIIPSLS